MAPEKFGKHIPKRIVLVFSINEFLKNNYLLSIMCINHQFLEFYYVLKRTKYVRLLVKAFGLEKLTKGTDALIVREIRSIINL